jgi:pyruvate dehydrogenase E1 component alpha subunit
MYAAAKEAIDRARAGGGPTLIEALTFRFHGHVFGDMDGYMKKGEKEAAMSRDPVPAFRSWLIHNEHASESELTGIESAIGRELGEAVEFALNSAVPDIDELRRDVFAAQVVA